MSSATKCDGCGKYAIESRRSLPWATVSLPHRPRPTDVFAGSGQPVTLTRSAFDIPIHDTWHACSAG